MKNIKRICLLQRCSQNPSSPLFPEHPAGWHFPASLKFSYEIWLTQWNVSKSEKHHSQTVPSILPCISFLFCFVSSNCLGCWWPHSYLRSHIGDGRMSIPLGPWMNIWRRAPHKPVHLFCSIIWGKTQKQTNKTKQNNTHLHYIWTCIQFASIYYIWGWIRVWSNLSLQNLRGHLYEKWTN